VLTIAVFMAIKTAQNKASALLKILPDQVDLQIRDFVFTEVGEGNSKWEVKAQTAKYYKKENYALFDKVQIKLTTEEKKIYTMTGDKGKMLTDKKNIEISGNVVIVSETGDRFTTDHLNYSDAEKKFYTEAPVMMESKTMKIKGVGLTLYMNTGELNLSSAIKANIK